MSGKADHQRPAADEQLCPSAEAPAGRQHLKCARFIVERTFLGRQIVAEVFLPGRTAQEAENTLPDCFREQAENVLPGANTGESGGIFAIVYGGERPHIGAVSIAEASGEVQTTQFPTHKDAAVSERWAKELLWFGSPAVVTAGIHYDNLSKENIKKTVEVTEDMLEEALQRLQRECASTELFRKA